MEIQDHSYNASGWTPDELPTSLVESCPIDGEYDTL